MKHTAGAYFLFFGASLFLIGCSGSRSVLSSGKVVPKGQVRFGENYTFNISSSPISESAKGSVDLINNLAKKDTVYYSQQLAHLNAAVLSYCLDPIGYTNEIYFRYGLGKHMDMGFKNSGGSHAVDMMYQFLGSNKNFNESDKGGYYGSAGLQFSWQNFRFVNYPMFDKLEKLFGMEMSRKDITLPVIFSKSFGPEERTGCFSFGVVYSHSFIKYKITPKNIYEAEHAANVPPELIKPISEKMHYGAYGTFINVKIGKRFVFFNFSLAAYYQDYGNYKLLGGSSKTLQGISIIPSYGIQFNILPKKKKTAGTSV